MAYIYGQGYNTYNNGFSNNINQHNNMSNNDYQNFNNNQQNNFQYNNFNEFNNNNLNIYDQQNPQNYYDYSSNSYTNNNNNYNNLINDNSHQNGNQFNYNNNIEGNQDFNYLFNQPEQNQINNFHFNQNNVNDARNLNINQNSGNFNQNPIYNQFRKGSNNRNNNNQGQKNNNYFNQIYNFQDTNQNQNKFNINLNNKNSSPYNNANLLNNQNNYQNNIQYNYPNVEQNNYNNQNLLNNQNNNQNNIQYNYQNVEQNNYNNQNYYNQPNTNGNNIQNLNPKTYAGVIPIGVSLDFLIRARGLDNVGATCYMNATLQCFYHVKGLSENLINDNKINSNLKLTSCYKNLVEELAGCKNRNKFFIGKNNFVEDERLKDSIKPSKFKDLISDMNPLFKGVQANDSKDLILFLLETMDKELTLRNNNKKEMETFYGNNTEDMEPRNFKKYHNSIFSEIFYGFQKSVVKCLHCQNENSTYSVMNFLLFPLEKIYNDLNKQKNNNINNNNNNNINNYYMNNNNMFYNMDNMNNNYMYRNMDYNMNGFYSNNFYNFRNGVNNNMNSLNPRTIAQSRFNRSSNIKKEEKKKLTLDDCFKMNKNVENLVGDNRIYCNNCRSQQDGVMFDEIHKAPNVLIIILNRGRGNVFECDVDFPQDLDLSNYITNPMSPKNYELIGVISHLGESSMEGHFIAYCKHFDDSWYLFNDSIVKQVAGDGMYSGIPYILFYKNKNWN